MFEQHNEGADDNFDDANGDFDYDDENAQTDEILNEWKDRAEREEQEKVWNDTELTDFELLKGIMQSEYGNNEFSNSVEITETGDYDLNLERDDPDRENYRKRANYIMLSRLLVQLEGPNFVVPSFDVMEGYGLLRKIKPRFSQKTGRFLEIDYKTDSYKPFKEIIVYGKRGILRNTDNKDSNHYQKIF